MPELIAPASSPEGVSAAVQSGADAVYVSFGGISASGVSELSEDEFGRAAEFCRVRGVKIYSMIELSPFDEDLSAAVETTRRALRMGADAIIASDIGLIWALRQAVPSMPIHAGSKLNIHNLDGVKLCAAMGAKRVCLSPELSKEELLNICRNSPIEIEILVHGPLCAAYRGQCRLSAFSAGESAMRGVCPAPCLGQFTSTAGRRHPLAMKDVCLLRHIPEIKDMGIAAVTITGSDRRPEYAAAVTSVYTRAVHTDLPVDTGDMELLKSAFPAAGFTDGYYTGRVDSDMMGYPGEESREDTPFYHSMRKNYLNREFQRVPVTFTGSVSLGGPLRLTARDDRGNSVSGEGGTAELSFHQELTQTTLQTELFKTGGTPFICTDARCEVEKGIYLNPQDIATLRDELLSQLMKKRVYLEPRAEGTVEPLPPAQNSSDPPVLTVSVLKASQLSKRMLELAPPVIYIPLSEIISCAQELEPFLSSKDISICAALPHVISDKELGHITEMLLKARQLGINEVLCGNPGHLIFARTLGFDVRGDHSLNIRNSMTLAAMKGFNLKSAALSLETSASRARSIAKSIDTELIVYGRIPLMYSGLCFAKNATGICSCDSFSGITAPTGMLLPVTHDMTCKNTVWSAEKLFLAGRAKEYLSAGLWGVRLSFTTENAAECEAITERYLELGHYEPSLRTEGCF